MPNFHRVVITGIGAVTPIGNNIDEYLVGLQTGTNGVSDITLFDPEQHPCKFAAEVKNLNLKILLKLKNPKDGIVFPSLELLLQSKPLMILDLKLQKLIHQELE